MKEEKTKILLRDAFGYNIYIYIWKSAASHTSITASDKYGFACYCATQGAKNKEDGEESYSKERQDQDDHFAFLVFVVRNSF